MTLIQKLHNRTKNQNLSNNVEIALTFKQRSVGLLGRTGLKDNQCLWIHKCNSVHTFFMKFAIDVVYVDQNLKITEIHRNLKPWRISWGGFNSKSCFEFQASALSYDLNIGDLLHVGP